VGKDEGWALGWLCNCHVVASEHVCTIHWTGELLNDFVGYMASLQISDFGMTREVESEMYYKLGKDTKIPVKWTAPEAILFKKYTTKSDIWSYGMLMYEIWSLGHKPFESNTVQEVSCSCMGLLVLCSAQSR